MAIKEALERAAVRLIGRKPQAFFGSPNRFEQELCDLVNEVAEDVAQYRDWQTLVRVATITPNGSESYALPADYDRMTLTSAVQDSAVWLWGYFHYDTVDQYLSDKNYGLMTQPGGWIIYQDRLHFYPAPLGTAQFPYVSKQWAIGSSGQPKSSFTSDTDEFVLPDRLLTLGLVWRWNENKGNDGAGDQEAFVKALDEYAAKDGGAKVIRYGGPSLRSVLNTRVAWSGR